MEVDLADLLSGVMVVITAITIGTLFTGSVEVAKAMAITGAIPFTFIVLFQIVGFLRALREEIPPVPGYIHRRIRFYEPQEGAE